MGVVGPKQILVQQDSDGSGVSQSVWNSVGAHFVSEACAWAGVKLPEAVSVLAGDHDLLLAEIAQPRLTCIDHAPRRVGYLAAAELDRLMQGGTAEAPVLVEPEGVIARDSVARVHVKDELVAEVIDIIRANAGRNITIQYLIDTVAVSRRNLERRFRQALGRGPAAEIRRLRLIEARSLLAETSLPIKQIAIQCGFANPEQLQRLLRSETGLTPVQYRDAHRRNVHPAAVSPNPTTTKNRDIVHRPLPEDLGNRIDENSTRVPLTPSLDLSHLESRKPPFVS